KATDLWQDIILGRELYLRYILDQSVLGKENPELLLMIEEYRDDRNVKFELDQICNKLNNDHITGPVLQSLINRFQETLDLAEEWLDYHRNLKKSVIRRNAYWQNVLNDYSLKADRAIKNLESHKGPVATLLKESLMEIKSQSLTSVISDDPSEESFRRTGGPIYLENPEYDLRARLIAVDKVKYTVEGHLPRLREFLKFLESKDQDSLGGYLRHLNNTELLIPYAFLKTKPHYAKLTHPDSPLTLKALFEEALAIYPQRVEAFLNDALFSLRNLRLTGAITRTDEGRLIVRLMAQKAELGTIRDSMPEEDPEEASSGQARSEDLELSDMPGIEYLEPLAKIRAEVQDSLDFMERLGSENLNSLRTAWAQNRELCLFGRGAPADTYTALSGGKSSNTRNTEDSVRELYDGEVNSHLDDGELRATRSLIRRLRHLTLEGEDLPALPMPVDNTNYLADFARFLNLSHNHPSPFHYVLEKESPNDQNSLNQCLAHWSKLANLHDLDTRALEEELQAFMNTFGVALPRLRNSLIMDGAPHYLRLYHIETTMFSAAPILVPKECQEALLMLSWCENPSAQDFEDYIERLEDNSSPLIILSFSALTLGQRARVLHMARRRGLNFFLTDMFHYAFMATLNLTAAPERRRAFLASSVISGNLNPYLESVKGESRVFGGRSRLVKQLWDTAGPSMLYGGRHLGKSAILRHLASDPARHKPKDGQHIIYEDASKYLSLSDLIIEAFAPLGFKLSDTEELLPKIVKFLKLGSSTVKIKRVLLLIDNADTLLEEDIALGLPNLTLYSEISDLSQGSFRVVFCGGRVTRLLSLYVPNPISKGKAPLIMGPMDETDAREILVPPLSTLGYELPNKSFPGRVLTLAEGYPGVLSGFGRALIDHAQESLSPDTFPPFKAADKEIVLSMDNLDLKSSLVKIFEDSLGSHPLHKLIAYTIFFLTKDQERSLFLETVEPQKILSELSSNHRDFESLGLESLILTLDEMVDLSILAREGAGYRLRPERSSAMLPRDDDLILSVVMGLDSEQTKMSSLSLNSRQLSSSFQNPQSLKAKLKESLEFSDSKLKPTHIPLEPDGLSFKDAFPSPLTFHQQHLILNASEDIVLIGCEAEGISRVKPQLMTLSLYNGHSVLDLTPNPKDEGPLDASSLNALLSPPNLKLLHPLEQNVLVIVDLNEGAPREIHLVKDFFLGIKELRRFTLVFLIHQEAEEKLPDLSSFSKSSIIKLQKWERGDLLRLLKDRLKEGDLEREVDELMELTQGQDKLLLDMIKTNSPGKLDPKKLGTLNPTLEPFPKPPSTQKDLGDRGHFEDHDVPNP
ncbi:MAG: ATP-binding protein, partial [Deltaproteobacteria bacterium]|nr:ATP-binding protein [Deltaproteobacteria bacterium]